MRLVFLIFCCLLIITSCLEPTKDSLFQDGNQSLVIEGKINDIDSVHTVLVSESVNGNSELNFTPISNAHVQISDETENSIYILENKGSGIYKTTSLKGKEGHRYRLEVEYDNGVYIANEQITQKPRISSPYIEYGTKAPFNKGYYLYVYSHINPDSIGYYKVEVTINDSLLNGYNDLLVFDDGLYKEYQVLLLPVPFKKFDTISVAVSSLSPAMYEYFMGLSKQTTNLFSNIQPPSVNPTNNYYPSALGYFQASSVYKLDTIIQ